ncbi:serine/threonine-protein kinase [Streptomyces bungoensis]
MEKLGPGEPHRIGAYRLLARLGAGGMGEVYLARSDRGRTVAVKLVREELAAQEEFRARFRHEVQAAQRVGGHWTAPVLDADTEAAVPWVATGYVAGPSLQQVVGHDHGALPERSVRILAAGLAHALQDIHAAGIVHRDLKPSNVLVTIDGPRVIDFGIARAMETLAGDGLTRTGSLVGSPGFMAPEQVRGDRITPACDVFCLGSVLAYAATGVLPFGGANSGVHALMFRIAQEEPDLAGVPEGIADLVRDCLRKDPAARPSLDRILELTGAEDTVAGGRSRDPWLPGALVAQLGRHAVRLLEVENPSEGATDPGPGASPGADGTGPGGADAPPAGAGAAGAEEAGAVPAPAWVQPQRSGGAPSPSPSPEHAAVADGGAVPPPGGPAGPGAGGPAVNHAPTMVSGQTPPPGPPPAAPGFGASGAYGGYGAPGGYGYPQQAQQHPQPHPHSAPYGYPQQSYPAYGGLGATPPYGPPPVGTPQGPERGNRRSTALLVVVALVVALGAGGSVYALMRSGGGTDDKSDRTVSPVSTASTAPASQESASPAPSASSSESPSASPSSDGAVPDAYLGTWQTSIENTNGSNSRELTISQGKVGDTVLTLVADGPTDGGGTYHCVFEAELTQQPGADGPLEIGPSTVTSGDPMSSCSRGEASEVTLLPDGRLRRTKATGGESLTYTKQ